MVDKKLDKQTEELLFSEQELNLLNYHRDNLENNNYVLKDGMLTTVYIRGITGPDNKIYNIPGYFDNREDFEDISEDELYDIAEEKGWFDIYPSYSTGKKADKAAQNLHKIIEEDGKKFMEALNENYW